MCAHRHRPRGWPVPPPPRPSCSCCPQWSRPTSPPSHQHWRSPCTVHRRVGHGRTDGWTDGQLTESLPPSHQHWRSPCTVHRRVGHGRTDGRVDGRTTDREPATVASTLALALHSRQACGTDGRVDEPTVLPAKQQDNQADGWCKAGRMASRTDRRTRRTRRTASRTNS